MEALPWSSRDVSSKDWQIQLIATAGGSQDAANFFGVTPSSRSEQGVLIASPPAPSARVDLSFVRGPQTRVRYAADLRSSAPAGTTWEVQVSSGLPEEPVTLTWPHLETLPPGLQPILTDLETGIEDLRVPDTGINPGLPVLPDKPAAPVQEADIPETVLPPPGPGPVVFRETVKATPPSVPAVTPAVETLQQPVKAPVVVEEADTETVEITSRSIRRGPRKFR